MLYIATVFINNFNTDTKTVIEFREYLRHFERELQKKNTSQCCNGVSLAQCHTLLEISKHTELTLNKLSKELNLDKSTVSRTVEGLVNLGLITRTIPKENRRIVNLNLTIQGKEVCKTINSGNNFYYSQVLQILPEKELSSFLSSFELIVNQMIKLNSDE